MQVRIRQLHKVGVDRNEKADSNHCVSLDLTILCRETKVFPLSCQHSGVQVSQLPHVGECVFGQDPKKIMVRMRVNFHLSRTQIAHKSQDRNLLKVHLHSFRHYFASRLYQQTHDIRYVQKKLGHKNIQNTEIYENSQPSMDVKSYVSKVATSDQEKMDLINLG